MPRIINVECNFDILLVRKAERFESLNLESFSRIIDNYYFFFSFHNKQVIRPRSINRKTMNVNERKKNSKNALRLANIIRLTH